MLFCFDLDTVKYTFVRQKLHETVVLPMQSRNQFESRTVLSLPLYSCSDHFWKSLLEKYRC